MVMEAALLAGYPYKRSCGKYLLHKEKQLNRIRNEICTCCCRGQTKNELIYKIMFWLGIILAVIAIIVTLIKELDEGVKSEDTILHLSIGELILAILSITTTFTKHLIKHDDIVLTQKRVKSDEINGKKQKKVTQRRKVQIILGITLFIFIGIILIGFLVMHMKDDAEHAYLTYTKYTTVITLFAALILDNIINDVLTEYQGIITIDQCKMLIHQLQSELIDNLTIQGDRKRVTELQNFVNNHEIFSLHETDHIIFLAPSGEAPPSPKESNGHNVSVETPLVRDQDTVSDWV